MKPGLYYLQFTSFDLSADPYFPPCEKLGLPKAGKYIDAFLVLERVGDEWVAMLRPGQAGSVIVTLRYSGQRLGGRYGIAGTMHGEMRDADVGVNPFLPAVDVRVQIAGTDGSGPATVEGFAQPSSPNLNKVVLDGRVLGRLRYSTVAGDEENDCPSALWFLQNCPGTGDACFISGDDIHPLTRALNAVLPLPPSQPRS